MEGWRVGGLALNRRLESRDQEFVLEMQLHGQIAVELDEEFILRHHFQ
jgi:hypothetical protein